jgi:hypothetical protein
VESVATAAAEVLPLTVNRRRAALGREATVAADERGHSCRQDACAAVDRPVPRVKRPVTACGLNGRFQRLLTLIRLHANGSDQPYLRHSRFKACLSTLSQAQSGVTIYGILDAT